MSFFFSFLTILFFSFTVSAKPMHGLSLYGNLKYPENFMAFDYVNPNAPKGGTLKQSALSSFDTLNPFSMQGRPPAGIGLLFDTLMAQSGDEPFSLYGLIAEKVERPTENEIIFFLNPSATFSNGDKVTGQDVLSSFMTLKTKGAPFYRAYYQNVQKAELLSADEIKFTFDGKNNRELPLILGQLPVISEKSLKETDFSKTTLTPLIGSGPYQITSFEGSRFILYERRKDYWGEKLPVNRGVNNFDFIRFDVYRDTTVALEALKAGAFDIRLENEAKKWINAYPNIEQNNLVKKEFFHHYPSGMQGFFMNIRRPLFQDRRVRKAIGYAFDFDWTNRHLFHSLYRRTESFFDNSTLKAPPLPTEEEKQLLLPYKNDLPDEIWTTPYRQPEARLSSLRKDLQKALDLLSDAGWHLQDGILKNEKGEIFAFDILTDAGSISTWERVLLPFIHNLKKIGIQAKIHPVDALQYKTKTDKFDFDMVVHVIGQSLSPGNEQRSFFGSKSADINGSANLIGIKNKTVDALIEKVISARSQKELETAVHALDRVLLFNYYVIPHWYSPSFKFVYRDIFGIPDKAPLSGLDIQTWWIK